MTMFIDSLHVDKIEPLERETLKIQKGQDNERGVKCSKAEMLDEKTDCRRGQCLQSRAVRIHPGSGRPRLSESRPFLYEVGDKNHPPRK